MFPYDQLLRTTAATPLQSIADVLWTFQAIDAICVHGDGLKWFNWLYLQVTQAVDARVASGGFSDPAWLAQLDVQFARLYLAAPEASLSSNPTPDCWQTLFASRDQVQVARIQFALAGMNAHINHAGPRDNSVLSSPFSPGKQARGFLWLACFQAYRPGRIRLDRCTSLRTLNDVLARKCFEGMFRPHGHAEQMYLEGT